MRGGRGGARPPLASQNGLAPPLANPAPPKNSLKMLLLGAIFEKKFWGGPQTPQIGAWRPPSEISFFAPLQPSLSTTLFQLSPYNFGNEKNEISYIILK